MQQLLLAWYGENRANLPWRHTHDPYAILVSEVMLQQSPIGLDEDRRNAATMRLSAAPERRP